jgi:hypothetical protein
VNGGERASTSQDAKAAARTMAALVSAHDWARTPLGPIENWPQSLRVAVGICLNSRFPMFVCWGPQLINIYNARTRAPRRPRGRSPLVDRPPGLRPPGRAFARRFHGFQKRYDPTIACLAGRAARGMLPCDDAETRGAEA